MAEQQNKKVPQIRFKGFAEDWVENTLGEILPITSAARVHKHEWTKSGVPFFRTSDVVSAYKGTENEKAFISYELYRELTAKIGRVKKGDILVTGGGSIGIPFLVQTDDPLYFKDADLLWLKVGEDIDSRFLNMFFSAKPFRQYVKSISHIGTIGHYTVEQAKSTPIVIPEEIEEQSQIGTYFQELDRMIGLHQQKHEKLVSLKKAMLKKMFPQNGATTPEIRFKGFSEPWEEKILGGLADRFDNLRVPVSAANRKCGNTPYYGANGIQDYVQGHTHDGEFILVAEDGASDVKNYPVQYVNGKIWVNNHAHVLQAKKKIADNLFLKYVFSQLDIEPFLVGGGRSKLNADTMMRIEMCVPIIPKEQKKIGTYFRQLDELIAQHSTQIDKLKQLKTACLEKMFV